jgi:hypothetical protein
VHVAGEPIGPPVQATARLLAGEESAAAGRLISRKHPLLQRILVPLAHRLLRTETLQYELTDARNLRKQVDTHVRRPPQA